MITKLCFGGKPLLPDRDSYQVGIAYGAVATDIGSGPVRVRAQYRNNSVNTTVTYTFNACELQWFMDVYYVALKEGQLPVEVRLDLNGSDLVDETWYVATIIGAPSAPVWTGIYAKISVTYNAVPIFDRCVSTSRIALYEAFGHDLRWVIDNVDSLVSPLARFYE